MHFYNREKFNFDDSFDKKDPPTKHHPLSDYFPNPISKCIDNSASHRFLIGSSLTPITPTWTRN